MAEHAVGSALDGLLHVPGDAAIIYTETTQRPGGDVRVQGGVVVLLLLCVWVLPAGAQESAALARVTGLDERLVVRARPFSDAEIIGTLEPDSTIIVYGRRQDALWLQTTATNGRAGWVSGEYVRVQSDVLALPVTHERNLLGMTADLSPDVVESVRRIAARGRALGRERTVFSKVGDSITATQQAYNALGGEDVNLRAFYYLQPTLDHYMQGAISGENPFTRESLAAAIGWSSPVVLNPDFADPTLCLPGESPLLCEYRLNNPSVALIMFGTNDVSQIDDSTYYFYMEQILQQSIEQGVIPVLSTIPPRVDYEAATEAFNAVLLTLTETYQVPLWDYGAAMRTLPNFGLADDGVHPTIAPRGVAGSADFRPGNLQYGFVMRNLTALQMLDAVRRAVDDE